MRDAAGAGHTLGGLPDCHTTLLLFVRHFGRIGCSESIGLISPRFDELPDLGARVRAQPGMGATVQRIVGQGLVRELGAAHA